MSGVQKGVLRVVAASALIVVASSCSDGGQRNATELTASTSSPIDSDLVDEDSAYRNASVATQGPAGFDTTLCSGTLITPLRVLTANHCVTGEENVVDFELPPGGWGTASSVDVKFGVDPTNPFDSVKTIAPGHPRREHPVREPTDISIDIAVLDSNRSASSV